MKEPVDQTKRPSANGKSLAGRPAALAQSRAGQPLGSVATDDKDGSQFAIATLQARSARSLLRIMDAAEDILRSDGIGALTIPEVAARSGISVGGIYRRFEGKQDLLRAVKDRLLSRLKANIQRSMDADFGSIYETVRRYITTTTDEMSSRGGLYTLVIANQGDDAVMVNLGHDLIAHNFAVLREKLLRFTSEIRHDEPELAIQFVYGIILSAVMRRNVRFPSPTETMSWDVFGREVTRMVASYLTTPA